MEAKQSGEDLDLLSEDFCDDSTLDDDLFGADLGYDDLGMGGSGVSPMEKYGDLLKDLTNFSPFLRDTFNTWLGYAWSEKEGKFVKDHDIEPIMNAKCAKRCLNIIRRYARNNNIITNISKEEYNGLMKEIIEEVVLTLGTNKKEFGITSNADLKTIFNDIQHPSELCLMGSGDGKAARMLSETVSRQENVSIAPPQQQMMQQQPKQGFISSMKNKLFRGN